MRKWRIKDQFHTHMSKKITLYMHRMCIAVVSEAEIVLESPDQGSMIIDNKNYLGFNSYTRNA